MKETLANFVEWAPQLFAGLVVSLQLTGLALLMGLPLGLLLALLSMTKMRLPRYMAILLVEIGRGAPALVVLQMVYYGLPSAGINTSAFIAAAVALALTTAAYTSEILRAGLNAVPQREFEAGLALGMTNSDIMRFVVIPQGVLFAVPALMGFAILIFQASALAFTISVPELLARAYRVGAATYLYLDVLILAGLFYLVVTIPFGWLVAGTERRLGKHLG
ncbi:ABC transporter permease subunit [Brucella anthropi]|jgi:polar amino acid transport system permease protein|uniref:amino acid ABC transporter permease n=1 Tax=Brucella/Ochrobactrum group TaxID=2826938 RepID=UPI000DDB1545|nr:MULTISPECIES: ABC transporter permease subunit [Brucella/Ochrobactrum group]MCH4543830.1 ABC transporter permease subunit [Ochrobactrum sp. A-1]KAB2784182.1 ABC transporter permease subunit [Brucella anthropi]KAB2793218.1 ABC transporter permease subunit [Brucella anthropi]MBA8846431.1 polar amino acid transport system permease protein [Ochrobactrum sp. RH1CCR137]MBA8858323.1 polar amino acid transport system permease protein [Ochrobactrum sp. RH1CCR134]